VQEVISGFDGGVVLELVGILMLARGPNRVAASCKRAVNDNGWWRSFSSALAARTSAPVLSIEHEDRLVAPEEGIAGSAAVLTAVLASSKAAVTPAGNS